jgi:TolA-binding protein
VGPTTLARPSRASERNAPEDLLQKANHQRSVAQFREAAATYAQVYERFPRTQSAYAARVAGAAIELEHLSNPTRARHLFEQALRDEPHGALDLEARQGLCVALRDLEDRAAEARALHALINAHPDSPAARRAQVRLRELGDNAE